MTILFGVINCLAHTSIILDILFDTPTYLSMITWFEKVSACSIAVSNDSWSFTSRTALVSSPLLALTTHGYWMCSFGIGSPVIKQIQ